MGVWRFVTAAVRAAFSATPKPIDRMIADMMGSGLAPRVTRAEALTVPPVTRARNLICSVGALPLVELDRDNRRHESQLLYQINPNVPDVVTMSYTLEDLLFEGISWWRVITFGADGYPEEAEHLEVGRVSLNPPSGIAPQALPSGELSAGVVWVDGSPVAASRVIRFDSPNPGILRTAGARTISRAVLLGKTAEMYARNPRPLDYFRPADGADPADDGVIRKILAAWRAARRDSGTAYVPAALEYQSVDQPTPADLQLAELLRQVALDIGNATGIDPEDLGVSTTSRTYQNDVNRRYERINDTFKPFMRAISDRLSMPDVTWPGRRVEFDTDEYLRPDVKTRFEVYQMGLASGLLTVDEIRADRERLPPLPPGAARAAVPAAQPAPALEATAGRGYTFDAPHTFDGPAASSRFAVDWDARTVTGLVLPYGVDAMSRGRRYEFAPGALQYREMGRVKLLRDHNRSLLLGRMVGHWETPAGVVASYFVRRGPEGDQALQDADDGILDGFSVGTDFFPERGDTRPHPTKPGVTLVTRADWLETSLTPMPSFDGARVVAVAASREEPTMQTCPSCHAALQPGVAHTCTPVPAAVAAFTQPDPAPVPAPAPAPAPAPQPAPAPAPQPGPQPDPAPGFAQFAAFAQAMGWTPPQPSPPFAPQPPVRAVVNPAAQPVQVTDPEPYVFDRRGNMRQGTHEFSQDIFDAFRGDAGARARVEEFCAAAFERGLFDVATGDVNELNPTVNRPDLYVDQRSYRYPVWAAISKGSLAAITPFTFPKFSSASGLVGNHTEGVEPTSGTLVTTSQTVTPTATSGKAKITRETIDQGGNPQVSNLIWRQMVKGWNEALEAAAVAVLDAASPTALATFTAGGGTGKRTLAAEMEAALAALNFIRGGNAFTDAFAQIDLYAALAAAEDTAGRKLYPRLGPANANGTATERWGAIDVNGTTFLPAWALAASGSVAASSYIFDREAVHGWASAPRRLDFEYEVAHVYIGIWGYKATAISDITGVREITYDPVA